MFCQSKLVCFILSNNFTITLKVYPLSLSKLVCLIEVDLFALVQSIKIRLYAFAKVS